MTPKGDTSTPMLTPEQRRALANAPLPAIRAEHRTTSWAGTSLNEGERRARWRRKPLDAYDSDGLASTHQE